MIKLVMALSCAVMLVGCGGSQSKHEKIVKEVYSIIQTGNNQAADKFWKENVSQQFQDVCSRRPEKINSSEFKKAFGIIAKSKDKVALKVIKSFEKDGIVMASAIEAQCAGTTLYFVVGKEDKDRPDQILGITSDKDMAMSCGQ